MSKTTVTYPLVQITWKDHYADDRTWVNKHEIDNLPEYCMSIGWIYKESEEGLSLVRDIDPNDPTNGSVGGVMFILKNCITKMTILRKGKK